MQVKSKGTGQPNQLLIRGPALRRRWGGMAPSTFYWRLKEGIIPPPIYPFGPATPYWRLEDIERFEAEGASK